MKRYIVLFWTTCLFLCGCEDFLTVKPKSDIKDVDLFSTAEGCEDALYGSYAEIGGQNMYGRQMRYFVPELLTHAWQVNQTDLNSGSGQINNYMHEGKGARDEYAVIWKSTYAAIAQINDILTNLQKAAPGKYRYFDYYRGEALGIRAFLHFDLLRLFAPHIGSKPEARAIPYVTTWGNRVTPFSTVGQVYKALLSDLKKAELSLEKAEKLEDDGKTTFLKNRQLHFNLDAARATLARVYWMRGDLDSACLYAEKVIETKKYKVVSQMNVKNMLASIVAQDETIWGIYQRMPFGSMGEDFYKNSGLLPRADALDFYESSGSVMDLRRNWFREKKYRPSWETPNTYFLKFLDEDAYNNQGAPEFGGITGFSLIRMPEMYYIAAEALLEKDPEKARAYFNLVIENRGRVGLQAGQRLTLQELNEERFREFFGEGYEWYNMKRQNRDLYLPASAETVKGSDERYTLTIPNEEFDYRQEE